MTNNNFIQNLFFVLKLNYLKLTLRYFSNKYFTGAKNKTYEEIKDAMHLPNIVSYPMVLFSRQTFKSKSLNFAQRVFLDLNATIEADYQNLLYL